MESTSPANDTVSLSQNRSKGRKTIRKPVRLHIGSVAGQPGKKTSPTNSAQHAGEYP